MPCYVVAEINVKDDSWIPEYAAKAHDVVHRHGGRYLTRTGNVEVLEGSQETPTIMALIEFPDARAVTAFAEDADYAPLATARKAGSDSRFVLLDSTDVAGTIDYLSS